MAVLTGQKAPTFSAPAVINGGEIVDNFSLEQFIGKSKVVFFFYPKDFTFVCPSELHAFQRRLDDFRARGCELVACSTDTQESHWAWLQTEKNKGGIDGVTYPIVADASKCISENFGVLAGDFDWDEDGNMMATGPMIAYRGLFLIDAKGVVQHQVVNNFPLGRSVDEALRMVDALNHFEEYGEVCPADWQQGAEAMKPTHEGVSAYLAAN